MRLRPLVIAASIWSVLTAGHVVSLFAQDPAPVVQETTPAPTPSHRELLDTYCVTCHNSKTDAGGVALDSRDPQHVGADQELWERVVRKLRAGTMPPQGVRRPDQPVLTAFVTHLESAAVLERLQGPSEGLRIGEGQHLAVSIRASAMPDGLAP